MRICQGHPYWYFHRLPTSIGLNGFYYSIPSSPPNSSNTHYLSSLGILSPEEQYYLVPSPKPEIPSSFLTPFSPSLLPYSPPTIKSLLSLHTPPKPGLISFLTRAFAMAFKLVFFILCPSTHHIEDRVFCLKLWSDSITPWVNTHQCLSLIMGQELKGSLGRMGGVREAGAWEQREKWLETPGICEKLFWSLRFWFFF